MKRIQDATRHVQATLTSSQYERFAHAAKRQGLSLQKALRQAAIQWMYTSGGETDPFDKMIGRWSGPLDASVEVDKNYDED